MKLTTNEVHAWVRYLFDTKRGVGTGFHTLESFVEAWRKSKPTGLEMNWDGVEAFHIIEELEYYERSGNS